MAQEEFPGVKQDPDNYRELSKPFESLAAAEKAVEAFWDELYELRNKHRFPDVCVLIAFNSVLEDGTEGQSMLTMHAGNQLMEEPMLAYAFGRASQSRQERLAKAISGSTLKDNKRRN